MLFARPLVDPDLGMRRSVNFSGSCSIEIIKYAIYPGLRQIL